MIALVLHLLWGATAVVLASLWFADRVLKREAAELEAYDPVGAKRAAIAEKRRILERELNTWVGSYTYHSERDRGIRETNAALLALADEEAGLAE
jgi:hypothetical protein